MSYHITNPNDTAFPDQHLIGQGLTKREFFAAMALQGILFDCNLHPIKTFIGFTDMAVKIADELIISLNQTQTNE